MKFVAERHVRGWTEEEDRTIRTIVFPLDNELDELGLYVELKSHDTERQHPDFEYFRNKRVRITVETVD